MTTIGDARDAIIGQFRTAWLASGTTSGITLLYDDVEGDRPGHAANGLPTSFARISVRHFTNETETIGLGDGGKDLHRGQVVVQVFTPKGDGYRVADPIAQVAKRAFQRRTITGIDGWYTGATHNEVPADGPWSQINVVAGFAYSEAV